jgi:hypothetical protein
MPVARVPGPLLQAIDAVTTWLREAGVPAAVIGGVAASLLGRPRVTKDVDLVALADEGDLDRLLSLGDEHGIRARPEDAVDFAKISRVLLLWHEPSGIEIDLSLASLPFEREVIGTLQRFSRSCPPPEWVWYRRQRTARRRADGGNRAERHES